jgi:prepilin signal peptidase PulO-like enzyme (type II secretory pathway)
MSQTAEDPSALSPATLPPPAEESAALPMRISWPALWILLLSLSAILASAMVFAAHGARGFFVPLLAGLVCLVAAAFDGCTGRIPNPLTYTAALAGLALNAAMPALAALHQNTAVTFLGGPGLQQSLLGFAACAGLWIVAAFFSGAVHGGDLKLLVALGALLGLTQAGNVLVLALSAAVLYALVNLLLAGRLNAAVRVAAARLLELVYLRHVHTPLPDDAPVASARHIPMAVPLALGLLVTYFWQYQTGGTLL